MGRNPKNLLPDRVPCRTAVQASLKTLGEVPHHHNATLPGQEEKLVGACGWSVKPLSDYTVADEGKTAGAGRRSFVG